MRRAYKRASYFLVGGPWTGKVIPMPDETMVFTVGNWRGKYVRGVWHDV